MMNNTTFEIRKLTNLDKNSFKNIYHDYCHYIASITNKKRLKENYDSVFHNIGNDSEFSETLVVIIEKEIVAFISYSKCFWLEENEKVFFVSAFSVLSKFRGHDIGKKLFDRLVYEAKTNRVEQIMLTVHHTNDIAQRFYNKYGFTEYKEEKIITLCLDNE